MYIAGLIVSCDSEFHNFKFFRNNTENEEFEKGCVLQKCPLTQITLIVIIIIIIIIIIFPRLGNTGLMPSRG